MGDARDEGKKPSLYISVAATREGGWKSPGLECGTGKKSCCSVSRGSHPSLNDPSAGMLKSGVIMRQQGPGANVYRKRGQ